MKLIKITRTTGWSSLVCPNCKKEIEIYEKFWKFNQDRCPYCDIPVEVENE